MCVGELSAKLNNDLHYFEEWLHGFKYLGGEVMLDQHLVWNEYRALLQTKISRSLRYLKYAKKFLPLNILNLIS